MDKLKELNAVLRIYQSNFLNLHWNAVGEEFNDAHKGISTDYYEMCGKYIDSTAEMIVRFGVNPPNYLEVLDTIKDSNNQYMIIDSTQLYTRKDIIEKADIMLGDIVNLIGEVLESEEISATINTGIRSDLEAMHSEFDLQYRYINKRRMG